MKRERITTDILIIGGGTAGLYGAYWLGQKTNAKVLVVEKANIIRSGCLAAGVNAINAYITKGKSPQSYVDYCKKDAKNIVREDLLWSMSKGLNEVTKDLEDHGLVILKDANGEYVTRGDRNIKINGENIKPILARMAMEQDNVKVLNHVNVTDYLVHHNKIHGAVGFHVDEEIAYEFRAKAVLIATGGAAGLYRPNNPGFSRHKMWYPPFNTGAGYAMGILAGAEMTTLEMRFIALRCKDTIAPTGTIAQGVKAKQVNALGQVYEEEYGLATCERVYGTTRENLEGRGPCYLKTDEISQQAQEDLYKAYFNMAPSQALKWLEDGQGPRQKNVEIQGTEPYIVGGHTASGYWVDDGRATTIKGLYAAGDVSGGAPQKYVTGALVEGKIAAESILDYLKMPEPSCHLEHQADQVMQGYERHFTNAASHITIEQVEETMQKVMDQYAGGIASHYQFSETSLAIAREKIQEIYPMLDNLVASNMDDLLTIYEIRDRLVVCQSLIEHLEARRETRWHCFAENMTYPKESKDFEKYVNSYRKDGTIKVVFRKLITGHTRPLKFAFGPDNQVINPGGDRV